MKSKMYKVINPGNCYPSYLSFFKDNGLEEFIPFYEMGRSLSTFPVAYRRFYIRATGVHGLNESVKIAVIQEVNSKEVYLINMRALEEAN